MRRYGPGEVRDDPAEEPVVRGEADEELQLVVLAQPRAGRLDAGNQFRVHPEEEGRNARIRAKLIAEIVKNYCPRLRESRVFPQE